MDSKFEKIDELLEKACYVIDVLLSCFYFAE